MKTIRTAAVIGSGVMGAAIAAHLANSGIPCLLLDIVPTTLTPREEQANLTLSHAKVRNRLAADAIAALTRAKQLVLYDRSFAQYLTAGNLEDDLQQLRNVDWIIEAVVERLEIKQQVLSRIESVWQPGTIVSTNTSGLSIEAIAEQCGEPLKRYFLGTHFFNPVRYMKLLEIIPGEATDPEIVSFMTEFGEQRLGKGVVIARDTPNFIANRIGVFNLLATLHEMSAMRLTVEEVDAVTGPLMGRPRSATFRTLDMIGLDVLQHAARNVRERLEVGPEASVFEEPAFVRDMIERGWLGEKRGQGFYKRVSGASGSEIHVLDLQTFQYAERTKVDADSLAAASKAKGLSGKLQTLLAGDDRCATFAWNVLKETLLYAARLTGEIADSILEIDRAMKWGYNWELGPFELWDAIGLPSSVQRMESEGLLVPAWIKDWIAAGHSSFYKTDNGERCYFHTGTLRQIRTRPEAISLSMLQDSGKVVLSNEDASLVDLGDEVACLVFHSKGNAVGTASLKMIMQSVEETERHYRGLVVANEGRNFCAGANIADLLAQAEAGEWEQLGELVRLYQQAHHALQAMSKPVVAAPHHSALGFGAEICLAADVVIYSPETYIGLVETGIGLIPAGGGCKEMARRASLQHPDAGDDLQPTLNRSFEAIARAMVSTSGCDANRLGFMRPQDTVIANPDYRVYEAKMAVLRMARTGFRKHMPQPIRIAGDNGKAVLTYAAYSMRESGKFSEYDSYVASKVAYVLSGGDAPADLLAPASYLYDLEREAFLSLLGEPKTQQRIRHLLATGKRLKN